MQKIHFKVALCHNNATVFRRFALENSASALYNPTSPNASIPFETLKCELISLFKSENLDKNFIVQYKDDESQWITFSSDEELAFAAKLMQNRLNLQLVPNTAQHHEPEKNRACGSDNVREQPPAKQIKKQEKQVAKKNAHLEQHRDKVTEKLTALKASENPKAAAKVEKLEQKLVAINAKLVDVPKQPTVEQPPELDVAAKNAKSNDKEEQPLNGHDRLVQHRDRIVEKISALQASQNPKHQAQVEQLQQKLVAVNTKLDAWIQAQKNKEAAKKANLEKRNAQKEALLKKREILSEKISVLKSRASDKPKDQVQLAKLEESVQAIDAKLLKLQPSDETKVASAVVVEISAPISDKAIVPVDKTNTALSNAKAKHKALNNELQEYKTHIGSMTKFLKLLKKNPNQVDDTMIHQTENFLGLLQQAFSAKKVNISDQAGVMKMLMKAQAKKQAEIEKKKNQIHGNDKKKGVEDKKSAPKKIVASPDSKIVEKQGAEQQI